MNRPAPNDPPPAYVAHRGVLIAFVVIAFVVFGLAVATQVPPLAQWISAAARASRQAWLAWNWHLL